MDTQANRLKAAREHRGYASGTDAARAMGVKPPTYLGHENGQTPITRQGERYARFFRVSYEWLVTGRGEMLGKSPVIPLTGYVGAGSAVEPIGDTAGADVPMDINMPDQEHLAGLVVRGESQWPRYLDGEVILYDTRARRPSELSNTYAVLDLADGRRMIKMLRPGRKPGGWIMESHNAPPEPTDAILAAYSVRGTLTR